MCDTTQQEYAHDEISTVLFKQFTAGQMNVPPMRYTVPSLNKTKQNSDVNSVFRGIRKLDELKNSIHQRETLSPRAMKGNTR